MGPEASQSSSSSGERALAPNYLQKVEHGSSFNSWAAVENIRGGLTGHYATPRQSKLLKEDGTLSKSDAETGKVFCKHFEKVFNNVRPINELV